MEDRAELNRARSMLTILLATATETLLALEAASNILDTDLTEDLRAMISRTERELQGLVKKAETGPA